MIKCPLCGYTFRIEESSSACKGCPLSKDCNMLRCPNCNYEFPRPRSGPSIIEKLRLRWRM